MNEGGHGFYRVRYGGELLEHLLARLADGGLAPIERFNLVNDTWAAAVAGLVPLPQYLEMVTRFRGERDRNVWTVLLASLHALNRVVLGDPEVVKRVQWMAPVSEEQRQKNQEIWDEVKTSFAQ